MAAPYDGAPPPQAPAAAPVAVVSPQFCAPYAVPLTVVKKAISLSGGDFVVTDANGAEMLRVKGAVFSIHDRRVLRDAAGQPLVSMREKVFSMHNRWEVFRGGQHQRKRSALHSEESFSVPAEDRSGCLPGREHRAASLRLQDQGQLLREIMRLLPRQLRHHDRSNQPQVHGLERGAREGHLRCHRVPPCRLRVHRGSCCDP
ncbi:hypothetical protein PVAP13_2KG147300 [Panicum virgatum]|uniref:Uncharacterized protein n=1 Tax=Panicum virgatum TaxID=38727 RepID=A0A8T0W6T5_PANVG|nr:hypothetical protein PVAP13_2KG147300 [Panicum virgatum]